MKKIIVKTLFVIICFCYVSSSAIGAIGGVGTQPVFDVSGWLAAIDNLYATYDMVNNTITQIENQYKDIQHAIEVAKGIDWENIKFDGDFDIRNDIRDANRRVNKLLTQARTIRDLITEDSINCGSQRYSIADLCGVSGSDENLGTAISSYQGYIKGKMAASVDAIEGNLTDDERKAIWAKYGISPRNYIFVQQSRKYITDQAAKVMAKATSTAQQMQTEAAVLEANNVVNAVMETTDSDGNPTQNALMQGNMFLTKQLIEYLTKLGMSIDEIGSLTAAQLIKAERDRQAESDEKAYQAQMRAFKDSKVSTRFIKGDENANSWIDIPFIQAFEYFGGIVAQAYKWAFRYGWLFGMLGIMWSAFKLMMSRMTVKDLWWDTLFKWVGFLLLLNLYPALTSAFMAIGNEIGLKAGKGQDSIVVNLTNLRDSLESDLENSQRLSEELKAELTSSFDNIEINSVLRDNENFNDYLNKVSNEIESGAAFSKNQTADAWTGTMLNFSSKNDVKKANEILRRYSKEYNSTETKNMFSKSTLAAINSVLKPTDSKGNPSRENLIDSYAHLDIYLYDANGDKSPFLSPSALLRVTILCCQIIWEKENQIFVDGTNKIKSEKSSVLDTKKFADLTTHYISRIPQMLECLFCCIALVLASIFAEIQYIMTILEYTIIVGIGALFIPLMLFDGTKEIPKKLIVVFTNFFVKIAVITICLMFVFYMMIENCINMIASDGGFNWITIAELLFESVFAFVLTQNAPKISQTILTGQPQLSMGEAMAAGATTLGVTAGMKQAPHAGFMAAAKGKAKVNDVRGELAKMDKAGEAAEKALGENATPWQKIKANFGAKGAVAKQDLLDRVRARYEAAGKEKGTGFSMVDKALQMSGLSGGGYGSAGGGAGGSSSAYGQTGQNIENGASLNNVSNPNFSSATKYDEKIRGQRSMTAGEFIDEKGKQGENIGTEYGKKLRQAMDEANRNKQSSNDVNNPIPENPEHPRLS